MTILTIIAIASMMIIAGSTSVMLVEASSNHETIAAQATNIIAADANSNASSLSSSNNTEQLKQFSSVEELKEFLKKAQQAYSQSGIVGSTATGAVRDETTTTTATETLTAESAGDANTAGGIYSGPEQPTSKDATGTAEMDLPQDFSTTNIQVQNVDEPDYLKSDGKYLYILSSTNLTIIDAYPPEQASIVTKIGLRDVPEGYNLQNMFLNQDRLVILYQEDDDYVIPQYGYVPEQIYSPKTHAMVLDISNRERPAVIHDYTINGNYHDARMTGNYAYLITTSSIDDYDNPILPSITDSSSDTASPATIPDVFYFDDNNIQPQFNLNTITAINIFDNATVDDNDDDYSSSINSQTFLMGSASTIYMSEGNIYITYEENPPFTYYETQNQEKFLTVVLPLLPEQVQSEIRSVINRGLNATESSTSSSAVIDFAEWSQISDILQEAYNNMSEEERNLLFNRIQNALSEYEDRLQEELQRKTVIHRIAASNGGLDYGARGKVPGTIINQFSMDEFDGRFRIATNSEFSTSSEFVLENNVYVLDAGSLDIVGELEGIAKGEDIYATRFMGDRLYMVTFERIDPFFVIDLSEDDPKVLGELKLPGYSTYLHPYDQNHIIGVGKETVENGGAVQERGVKVALFNVSDVENPVAIDVFEIGSSGTTSDILDDHKAFLFDREKNVLSIPIYMSEGMLIDDQLLPPADDGGIQKFFPREHWRGFYVFGVNPEVGFVLKGTIEHTLDSTGAYGGRSFYIREVLYTVTEGLVKMNDLDSIEELNEIRLHDNNSGIIRYYTD